MKHLFSISDSPANKISYYHVMLLLLSLPYDRFYSHIILISLVVHTLINLRRAAVKPLITKTTLVLQAVFLLTLIGACYAANKSDAFSEVGKQSVILLLPVILCLNPLDLKKYRDKLLTVFALGSTLAIAYLYAQALVTIHFYGLPLKALFSPAFTNHNFSQPFDIHATFFSMQIAIALVFLLSALVKETSRGRQWLYLLCCGILAAGIVQLSSKSVFVALLIIVNIAIPYFLLRGRRRIKFALITACLSAVVITGIVKMDGFKERFVKDLAKDLSKATADELTDPRLARWGVALQLAAQSPVIGRGSGSEIALLHDRFFEHHFYRSYLARLNAHNQYISFLIKTGIIGLLVYMGVLFYGFKLALTRRDFMLLSFMLLITLVSLSENYLDVDKGIFFYAVFFSLFVFAENEQSDAGLKV